MDHRRVLLKRKGNPGNSRRVNRRPVKVKVTIIQTRRLNATDFNNNQTRILIRPVNPTMSNVGYIDLPPVSLCVAVLQVVVYLFKESMGVESEEMVYVSWKTVVEKGEVWRLLCAQFFHFGKVPIFFNVITLMGIGRYLEKKIRGPALALLIIVMSVVSNILYILISDLLCSEASGEHTVGFSTTMFSLRMIHIFTMDSAANNGKGDPNLIFGFFPVHLPPYISPWQPVIETIFFDIFVIGRCIASTISGMLAGLLFPYLMKNHRNFIMHPRNPPPPPPNVRARRNAHRVEDNINNNNNDDSSTTDDTDESDNTNHND